MGQEQARNQKPLRQPSSEKSVSPDVSNGVESRKGEEVREEEEGESSEDPSFKSASQQFMQLFFGAQQDESCQIRVVLVGAGNRGTMYSHFALERPGDMKIVAVAEPREVPRERIRRMHNLPPSHCFSDWRDIVSRFSGVDVVDDGSSSSSGEGWDPKDAQAVIIATQDRDHREPAIAFAQLGYDILLEKPMAQTEEECEEICRAVEENGVMLACCHVLRYSLNTQAVKKLLRKNAIGKILHIQHLEPVGWYHFAHSYVRGNWHNEADSNFVLMTKSCHDIDLICYFLDDEPCTRVSSFGDLTFFNAKNKPEGVGDEIDRCTDCPIESECIYSALLMYERANPAWARVLIPDGSAPTKDKVRTALETGPYGKCVFQNDNDVCDNQCVQMQFRSGVTATFSMVATTRNMCRRKITIFGSLGEIRLDGPIVEHHDFRTGQKKTVSCGTILNTNLEGHGYADYFLMESWVEAVASGSPERLYSDARSTLRSHKLVFRAEQSRVEGRVIRLDEQINESDAKFES